MKFYKYWFHGKEHGPVRLGDIYTDIIEFKKSNVSMIDITLEVKKLGRTLLRYERFKPPKDWRLNISIPDNRYKW